MNFDSVTVMVMFLIVLLTLIGLSRSLILYTHEMLVGRILNAPLSNILIASQTTITTSHSWDIIKQKLLKPDREQYDSMVQVLDSVQLDLNADILEARKHPLTTYLIPGYELAIRMIKRWQQGLERGLAEQPLFEDTYDRAKIYRLLQN